MSNSFATPWTIDCQAPLSMGFPRHEYWSGLPFPSPGDLPTPGIKPPSTALAGGFFTTEPSGKPFQLKVFLNFLCFCFLHLEVHSSIPNIWGFAIYD